MKISELIEELEKFKDQEGDLLLRKVEVYPQPIYFKEKEGHPIYCYYATPCNIIYSAPSKANKANLSLLDL